MRVGARGLLVMAVVVTAAVLAACSGGGGKPDVVIGSTRRSTTTAPDGPVIPADPAAAPALVEGAVIEPAAAVATPGPAGSSLKSPDGRPYPGAIPFRSSVPVPSELTFVLVVGSDARPGQDIRRTNGDSIHLLAVNPRTGQGTVLGLPRDSYVDIPGRGRAKLNSALSAGGPSLMAETVRRLTGLPVHFYVLTGFSGFAAMVDELGGVEVPVGRSMNDAASGARFAAGLHHFDGAQALAFSRNRKDVPGGDFGRSANQGTLMLAALAKMRAEVGDDGGLRRWVEVLMRHASLDVAPDRLVQLAALARGLDPANLRNIVVPGRIGNAGRQSVVFLGDEATRIFVDLRDDAVVSGTVPAGAISTPAPATGPAPGPGGGGSPPAPAPAAPGAPPEAPTTTTTTPLIDLSLLFPKR